MKILLAFVLSAFAAPPETVKSVDLPRFMGDWYEIARLPNAPEKGCTDVVVRYRLNDAGGFDLENTCWKGETYKVYKGKALPEEAGSTSKFRARFFYLFRSDYWIIDLDPDYRWAVVANRDKDALWIIHREMKMPEELYAKIVASLKERGFPIADIIVCEHSGRKPPAPKP